MPIPDIYVPPPGAICEAKWKEGKAQTTQTTPTVQKEGDGPKEEVNRNPLIPCA